MRLGLGSSYTSMRYFPVKVLYILFAYVLGIRIFDTARQYADGESILGSFLPAKCDVMTKIGLDRAVTKQLPSFVRWGYNYSAQDLKGEILTSLSRLKKDYCYGVLLHSISRDFDFNQHIQVLQNMKKDGKIKNIGFSVDKGDVPPTGTSWADIIQIHVSFIREIRIHDNQVLVINGVFREKKEKELMQYVKRNPHLNIILLLGTSRFFRLAYTIFKYRLLFRNDGKRVNF